jgi:hypothetical protein
MAEGTKADPWELRTPPGTSLYAIYRDDETAPPVLICQVGTTTLRYDARAIDDLHEWLRAEGTGSISGQPTRRRNPPRGLSRRGDVLRTTPLAAGTGCETAIEVDSECTSHHCSSCSASRKSPTRLATTRCERSDNDKIEVALATSPVQNI